MRSSRLDLSRLKKIRGVLVSKKIVTPSQSAPAGAGGAGGGGRWKAYS